MGSSVGDLGCAGEREGVWRGEGRGRERGVKGGEQDLPDDKNTGAHGQKISEASTRSPGACVRACVLCLYCSLTCATSDARLLARMGALPRRRRGRAGVRSRDLQVFFNYINARAFHPFSYRFHRVISINIIKYSSVKIYL